jgi:hypothetical protein
MVLVIAIRCLRSIWFTSRHSKTSASLSTYGREASFVIFQYVKISRHLFGIILTLSIELYRDGCQSHGLADLLWGSS